MADRYSPGWRPASTSRLLPRRIHLPLQSPQIKGPRAALSSPRPTSPRRWTRALQRHRQATGFQRLPDNGAMKGIPILFHSRRVRRGQQNGRTAARARGDRQQRRRRHGARRRRAGAGAFGPGIRDSARRHRASVDHQPFEREGELFRRAYQRSLRQFRRGDPARRSRAAVEPARLVGLPRPLRPRIRVDPGKWRPRVYNLTRIAAAVLLDRGRRRDGAVAAL